MLVLARKNKEEIVLDFDRPTLERLLAEQPDGFVVRVSVLGTKKCRTQLGILAPQSVGVHRQEVYHAIQQQRAQL